MASNKENMKQAMKELLGLVGFGPEGEAGEQEGVVEQPVKTAPPVEERPVARTAPEPRVEREPAVERRPVEPKAERPVTPAPEPAKAERPAEPVSQPRVERREPPKTEYRESVVEEPVKKAEPERKGFFSFMDPKPAAQPEDRVDATPETQDDFFGGYEDEPIRPPFIRPGATVIAAGTTFFGDIRAEGDVEVLGKVKGNLEATGNVRITGKVLGDVKGEAVVLSGCAVQGNVTSTSSVTVDEAAMIVGDVLATDFESAGKVKGNIQIARAAVFFPTAILAGNVMAGTIMMNQGARIQGAIRIAEDPETNALFGEGLEI